MSYRLRFFQIALSLVAIMSAASVTSDLVSLPKALESQYQEALRTAEANGSTISREAFVPEMRARSALSAATHWIAMAFVLALVWYAGQIPAAGSLAIFIAANYYSDDIAWDSWILAVVQLAMGFLMLGGLIRFATTFPMPLTPARLAEASIARGKPSRTARLLGNPWPPTEESISLVRRLLLNGRFVWLLAIALGLSASLPIATSDNYQILSGMILIAAFGFAVHFLRASFRISDEHDRRRILWIMHGFYAALWAGFVYWAYALIARAQYPTISALLGTLPELIVLVALAAAVFYRGAIDPSLAIRQTTVYGALGVALLFVFGGVQDVASDALANSLGLSSTWGTWLGGGATAVAFGPLHRVFSRGADRFLNRVLPVTLLAEGPRRNAVIVFSDVVGYTGMSAVNERDALILVAAFHRLARLTADNSKGRLVKTIGDAVLLEFPNMITALGAVRALGPELARTAGVLGLPAPRLRTGVHYGEVAAARDGDLFGDTVNIASRLQTSAEPGEVIVSAAAASQADEAQFEPAGDRVLKNVPAPVASFRLRNEALEAASASRA